MHQSLLDVGLNADSVTLDAAATYFKNLHVELAAIFPGVQDLLENLKKMQYQMGVITNSFEGNAVLILKKMGIESYFSTILDGGIMQGYKPMKKVFELAVESLRSKIDSTLVIGDEYYADIIGAARVGLKTVWIDHREQGLDAVMKRYNETIIPDLVIKEIGEFSNYL
jgi:HAD superfamily hydrolase (TIGR01549 family)